MDYKLEYIKIAVTFDCNLSCEFCSQQFKKRDYREIPYNVVTKILNDEDIMDDLRLIILTGGEPLVRYDLSKRIIQAANRCGIETGIFTNGVLITEENLAELRQTGLDWIRISLYDPIDFEWLSRIMSLIKKLSFKRKVKIVITRTNLSQLETTLDKILDIGIDELDVKPFSLLSDINVDSNHQLSYKEHIHAMRVMTKFQKQVQSLIKITFLPLCYEFLLQDVDPEDLSPCNCGKKYLYIEPSGDIKPCPSYRESIGNIHKDKLGTIWKRSPLLEQIRRLSQPESRPEECKECPKWEQCVITDCHVITYNKYGDFSRANPQCPQILQRSIT
jgi:radical SAM protein with 4Fe4S-binding SPASM domain